VLDSIGTSQVVLRNVADGGKGSSNTRKVSIYYHTDDAPGRRCNGNEASEPTLLNLKMVDNDGDILIDDGKTVVCRARDKQVGALTLTREVFFQGPKNCLDSAVPTGKGFTDGPVTATASIPYQELVGEVNVKCRE